MEDGEGGKEHIVDQYSIVSLLSSNTSPLRILFLYFALELIFNWMAKANT